MKIMVPLKPSYSIPELVNYGASGFYIGFVPQNWLDKYGSGTFLNRRGHVLSANFDNNTIEHVIEECHSLGTPVYCTFNNHQYTKEELELVFKAVSYLHKLHIDGIIVSDINLLSYCKRIGVLPVLSTCATNYNRFSCEFYKNLGAKRIIFPRDITLDEMSNIIDVVQNVEWEAFILNSACRFSESVCLSNHGLYGNICKRYRTLPKESLKNGKHNVFFDYFYDKPVGSCGLCEIYRMKQMGVSWVKIVERTLPGIAILESCKKVRLAIELCEMVESEMAYREKIKRIESCVDEGLCYYK